MTETTASDDNPLRRLGNAGLALPLLVGVTMSLLCFVLAARYSAGDVHAYVSGAEALFCGGAIDPTSLYHQRIGMLLGAGLTMAPFDWALWSVVIFPALTAGATAGLIVVACRMWLPSLPAHIGALLPFCMQGLITKGATLAPDVPQAAAFSASLLLLFQPEYKLPSKCCAFLAGTLFALMLTFNQAGGRLGAVIVVLGVWWYWKVPGHRRRLIVLAATAGGGLLFGMVLTGLVQFLLHGDALLLWRWVINDALSVGFDRPEETVDGTAALGMWLRGAFLPLGEFALTFGIATFGLVFGWRRMRAGGTPLASIWVALTIASVLAIVLPGMLKNQAMYGEVPTRYILPAVVGVALLAGAFLASMRRGQSCVVTIMLVFSAAGMLMGFAPERLTIGPEEILGPYRNSVEPLYADKRLARVLSAYWVREVRPLEQVDQPGIAILSQQEEAFVQRKYAGSRAPLPAGFVYAEHLADVAPKRSWYSLAGIWLKSVKNGILGRTTESPGPLYIVKRIAIAPTSNQ